MTDVTIAGRRASSAPRRATPLMLKSNVLEIFTRGHPELLGSKNKPSRIRIAEAAGLPRQRLYEAHKADPGTLGTLVRCYADIHGVTTAEAMAAILCLPDEDESAA